MELKTSINSGLLLFEQHRLLFEFYLTGWQITFNKTLILVALKSFAHYGITGIIELQLSEFGWSFAECAQLPH